jgi:hypothetical protein
MTSSHVRTVRASKNVGILFQETGKRRRETRRELKWGEMTGGENEQRPFFYQKGHETQAFIGRSMSAAVPFSWSRQGGESEFYIGLATFKGVICRRNPSLVSGISSLLELAWHQNKGMLLLEASLVPTRAFPKFVGFLSLKISELIRKSRSWRRPLAPSPCPSATLKIRRRLRWKAATATSPSARHLPRHGGRTPKTPGRRRSSAGRSNRH